MNLNATLLGQMITFAIFVWFTMRFVWPTLAEVLKAREIKIADGLAAAEKGHETLASAQQTIKKQLHAAREKADQLIDQANHEAEQLIIAARAQAQIERDQILAEGQAQIAQQREQAHLNLQNEVATLAIVGAEKILSRAINDSDHNQLFDQAMKDLG